MSRMNNHPLYAMKYLINGMPTNIGMLVSLATTATPKLKKTSFTTQEQCLKVLREKGFNIEYFEDPEISPELVQYHKEMNAK